MDELDSLLAWACALCDATARFRMAPAQRERALTRRERLAAAEDGGAEKKTRAQRAHEEFYEVRKRVRAVDVLARSRARAHMHARTHVRALTHSYTLTHLRALPCARANTHTHAHASTHTHTHASTHARLLGALPQAAERRKAKLDAMTPAQRAKELARLDKKQRRKAAMRGMGRSK